MSPVAPFTEVGERVLVARYAQWNVSIGLVLGQAGALVIDTRASGSQGRELLADARAAARGLPVTHVVNTHVHFDHTFGNVAFEGAVVHAHANVARTLDHHAERIRAACRESPHDAPEYGYTAADLAEVAATRLRPPDETFTRESSIDLGDRLVALTYYGRGHTDGDIRIGVPDADVVFLGDLIEEAANPSLGGDCWPLEWADTLTTHAGSLGAGTVVVPGHGDPVDVRFVRRQRDDLAAVADVIRERRLAGLPLDAARREPDDRLPYPLDWLQDAFARGWEQLPGPAS